MAENRIEIRVVATGAAEAARVLQGIAAAGGQVGRITAGGAKEAEQTLSGLGSTAKRIFEIFTGVSLGNLFVDGIAKIKDFTAEVVRMGREARVQEESFRLLTQQIGVNGEALSQALQHASADLVNTSDILLASARALQQGLQPDQLVGLMEIARAQAKLAGRDVTTAFNDITQAVATQQVRALKAYGIVIDLNRAYEEHARRLGTVKEALTETGQSQALAIAVQEQMRGRLVVGTSAIIEQEEAVKRLGKDWAETKESVGKNIIEMTAAIAQGAKDGIGWFQRLGQSIADTAIFSTARARYYEFFAWLERTAGPGTQGPRFGPGQGGLAGGAPLPIVSPGDGEQGAASERAARSMRNQQEQVDKLKQSLVLATRAIEGLSLAQARGTVDAGTFAAGIQTEIAKLQALADPTEEIRVKIQALQMQLAGAQGAMATALASGAQLLSDIAGPESERALSALARQFETLIAKAGPFADELRKIRDAAIAAFKGEVFTIPPDVLASQASLAKGLEGAEQPLQDMPQITAEAGESLHTFAVQVQEIVDPLGAFSKGLQGAEEHITGIVEEIPAATNVLAQMSLTYAELSERAQRFGQGGLDLTQQKIAAVTKQMQDWLARGLQPSSEQLQVLGAELRRLRGEAALAGLQDDFRTIGAQAGLLGNHFDAVGQQISSMESALRRLAQTNRGEVTPEMQALAGQLEEFYKFRDLKDMFTDIFSSVGGAINTLVQGVIQGTQTMADAFKKLGQSIVVEFVNRIIQQALNPLVKAAAGVVAGLFAPVGASAGGGSFFPGAGVGGTDISLGVSSIAAIQNAVNTGTVSGIGAANWAQAGLGIASKIQSLFSGSGGLSSLFAGVSGGWDAGFGGLTGALSGGWSALTAGGTGWSGALSGFGGSLGTLGGALGAAGAAVNVFMGAMNLASDNLRTFGTGVAQIVGTVAGAIIGTVFFGQTWIGAGLGGALGGLLGQTGLFDAKTKPGVVANVFTGGAPIEFAFDKLGFNKDLGKALNALINPASLLDDVFDWLFGSKSKYQEVRQNALDAANSFLGTVSPVFQAAARSGDQAQLLGALQFTGTGAANNSIRSELVLPSNIAEQLGITGQQIGDQLVAQWSTITLEQFHGVIQAFKEQPDLINLIRGSGDTPYLNQGQAEQIASQIQAAAQGLIRAFISMEEVRDKIRDVGSDLVAAAQEILPGGAARGLEQRVEHVRERILDIITSALPEDQIQAQLDAIAKELQAYAGQVALYAQITQDMAAFSGDLVTQARGIAEGMREMRRAADSAFQDARSRYAEAISPEEQLAAGTQLRQAILDRYQLEVTLVGQIEGKIKSLLDTFGGGLVALQIKLAQQAGPGATGDLLGAFAGLTGSASSALQAYGVQGGISTLLGQIGSSKTPFGGEIFGAAFPFLDAMSTAIKDALDVGDLEGALAILQQQATAIEAIGDAAVAAVEKWRDAQIQDARDAAAAMRADANKNWDKLRDLVNDTYEEQNAALQESLQLAQAWAQAIESAGQFVTDLRRSLASPADNLAGSQAAFAASQAAFTAGATPEGLSDLVAKANILAGDIRANADAEIAAANASAQAQIAGIQDAGQARLDQLQDEQSALQKQIELTQQWESALKSVQAQINDLLLGPQGGLTPADQLLLAQEQERAALAAFRATPTTESAAAAQDAVRALVTAASSIPGQDAVVQQAVADLRSLEQGIGGQIGTPSDVLTQRLADLTDQMTAVTKNTADQVAAVEQARDAQIAAIEAHRDAELGTLADVVAAAQAIAQSIAEDPATIQDQIDALNLWKTEQLDAIETGRAADLAQIDHWLRKTEKSIDLFANKQVSAITAQTTALLTGNATLQGNLFGLLVGTQQDLLLSITGGKPTQQFLAEKQAEATGYLREIRDDIRDSFKGAGHAAGIDYVPRTGMYKLHQGETVVPAGQRGGRVANVSLTVNVNGNADAKGLEEVILQSIRRGKIRRALQEAMD